MSSPSATVTVDAWVPPTELAAAIKLAASERGMSVERLCDSTPHMSKSKLYRRLSTPTEFMVGEILELAAALAVPPNILMGGRLATLRYLNDDGRTPDGGPATHALYAPWDLNPEPADMASERTQNLNPVAA